MKRFAEAAKKWRRAYCEVAMDLLFGTSFALLVATLVILIGHLALLLVMSWR